MGLDLDCNGLSVRVGSYGSVRYVRHFLIDAIKKYIETADEFNGEFTGEFTDELIDEFTGEFTDEICETLYSKGQFSHYKDSLLEGLSLCYTDCAKIDYLDLRHYDLNGFECFINHSDCDGYIRSYDAYAFVNLCDKLYDYFDKTSHYFDDGKFYLYDIFKESANSGEDIIFC